MNNNLIRIRNKISSLYKEDENIDVKIEKFFVKNVYFIQILINNTNITKDFSIIINKPRDYNDTLGSMIVITSKPGIIKEKINYIIEELLFGVSKEVCQRFQRVLR